MCQFIETIKVQNKELQNIEYHNLRFNKTLKDFWGFEEFIDLKQVVQVPREIDNKIYKCRIIYSDTIKKVEFLPYKIKPVSTLQIITDNLIDYCYKYLNRTCFEKLLKEVKTDDILIVKKGYITDTSFSNIAFYDGNKWVTPLNPLLYGTKLNYLVRNNMVYSEELQVKDLKRFEEAKLINALLDLEDSPSILIKNIRF